MNTRSLLSLVSFELIKHTHSILSSSGFVLCLIKLQAQRVNLIKTKHKTWCEEGRTNGACFHSFVFSLSPFVLPFPHTLSLFSRCKREGKQKERQWSEVKRAFLLFPSSFTWCGYLIRNKPCIRFTSLRLF